MSIRYTNLLCQFAMPISYAYPLRESGMPIRHANPLCQFTMWIRYAKQLCQFTTWIRYAKPLHESAMPIRYGNSLCQPATQLSRPRICYVNVLCVSAMVTNDLHEHDSQMRNANPLATFSATIFSCVPTRRRNISSQL